MPHPLLIEGLYNGLLWYPFVLAAGCRFSYDKQTDVSIDGTAILCGIASAVTWQATGSLLVSLAAAIAVGVACAVVMYVLMYHLRIQGLIAGVVLTLAYHSVSVLWVGESLPLHDSPLVASDERMWVTVVVLAIALSLSTELFYGCNLGLLSRALAQNSLVQPPIAPVIPRLTSGAVTGIILGMGAAAYVHTEGVARAGGGFEFLLTGLTSFLAIDRVADVARRRIDTMRRAQMANQHVLAALALATSVPSVAIIGSVFFQILIVAVIRWSPVPEAWKMILAFVLLATLADTKWHTLRRTPRSLVAQAKAPFILHADDVSYTVSGKESTPITLFRGLSLRANREMIAVVGDNGTGKSSFLRILGGYLVPDSGTVYIGGRPVSRLSPHMRRVFLLHQQPRDNVPIELTVAETFGALCEVKHRPFARPGQKDLIRHAQRDLQRWPSLGDTVAWSSKRTGWLSGGECQRLAVALALSSECSVLLADEPTACLDHENRTSIASILKEASLERTVLVATHDEEIKRLANRQIVFGKAKRRESKLTKEKRWFEDSGNDSFFGNFYYEGDHSVEGFIPNRPMTVPERTSREVNGVIRLLDITPGNATLLDAPCGYGRHLIELRRRGFETAGVDLCRKYVDMTNALLAADGFPATVSRGELRKLPFADVTFDAILNLFFAFGFYEGENHNLRCLKEFARVLKPGGKLLLHTDVNMLAVDAGNYKRRAIRTLESGHVLRVEDHFSKARDRMNGKWTISHRRSTEKARSVSYSMRVYYPEEFEMLAAKAGFGNFLRFGSFDHGADTLHSESPEMIIVAQKL